VWCHCVETAHAGHSASLQGSDTKHTRAQNMLRDAFVLCLCIVQVRCRAMVVYSSSHM
jgi:hypothetical protein